MSFVFSSVFAKEIQEYLTLLSESGRRSNVPKYYLRSIDQFLTDHDVSEKKLSEWMISKWLLSKPVLPVTRKNKLSVIKGFAKYLSSLGVIVNLPEAPRENRCYVPYIFSEEEITRIIFVADNLQGFKRITKSSLLFPILLRLLYGCGLRLGEGLALTWKDIDFESGVITVRTAKNMKQRFVPMSGSMCSLLKKYQEMVYREGICSTYLFETESRYEVERPYKNAAFGVWFKKVLYGANIIYERTKPHERGPCPHCLRHSFVFHSFLKFESEGRAFTEITPLLSAYLGHVNLYALEKYLRADYSIYEHSHQRVGEYIDDVFPEVSFL